MDDQRSAIMHATQLVRTLLIAGVVVTGLSVAQAGSASARETPMLFGRDTCEQVAQNYRSFNYQAACVHMYDDKYYVWYSDKQLDE